MTKRVRQIGDNVTKIIRDRRILDALKPWNALDILRAIAEFENDGVEVTPSVIARSLNIPVSTVIRNVARFNDVSLVSTTKKNKKEYLIKIEKLGRDTYNLVNNSEYFEKIEIDRVKTNELIVSNKDLLKDLKAMIHIREKRLEYLLNLNLEIKKKIKIISHKKDYDSKLELNELKKEQLMADDEILNLRRFIAENKNLLGQLVAETKDLQRKLDDFLTIENVVIK